MSAPESLRPTVTGRCRACRVRLTDVAKNRVIVSPSGMAHFGEDGGTTACGRDATGDRWWWLL